MYRKWQCYRNLFQAVWFDNQTACCQKEPSLQLSNIMYSVWFNLIILDTDLCLKWQCMGWGTLIWLTCNILWSLKLWITDCIVHTSICLIEFHCWIHSFWQAMNINELWLTLQTNDVRCKKWCLVVFMVLICRVFIYDFSKYRFVALHFTLTLINMLVCWFQIICSQKYLEYCILQKKF